MPKPTIQCVDIVDCSADAVIYSTNVFLNCSGGAGASFLQKYGEHFQKDLHALLKQDALRYAPRGSIFRHVPEGLPYQMMFHTVPCDGFYETSDDVISGILLKALSECDLDEKIQTVSLSALAAGYGRYSIEDFLRVASAVFHENVFNTLSRVTICIPDPMQFTFAKEQIAAELLEISVA